MSSSAGVAISVSRKIAGLALSGLIVLAFATADFSQQNAGSIKGAITDQLGGLVVNATVIAIDAHGTPKTTTTNSNGVYEFRALAPGKYSLRVTATGFNALEANNVEVQSGKSTTTDIQLIVGSVEQTVTIDKQGVSTDSDQNADARVLRERELEALPNEPEALAAALQAMAGPPQGENGPQIKVDGFSNGQVPPKEAIREVRINNNPYSAENEYPGWGGIEIYTQPGSDKYHGNASFGFLDESLNSRDPFARRRAPFQQRLWNANLTGPIKKKRASFAFYFNRQERENNAVINATILDPTTLKPTIFNQTVVTPALNTNFTGRGDLKINKKHTLVSSYQYGKGSQNPQGIGGFSLPSRASHSENVYHTFQLTETAVINERTINETRLQIAHSIYRQVANTTLPALNVQDSFFGGGSQIGVASNTQDRGELQNFTSWQAGKHFLKIGGRLRYVRIRSIAPSNFGGTYTFAGGFGPALDANDQVIPGGSTLEISSLERYRRTLVFQRLGMTPAQIRNLGGGATQFSIAGGNPEADVRQNDISLYVQDEWKVRPNLTISPGLRYENQENIKSDFNFAPRIGFAWSPTSGGKKKPPTTDAKAGTQAQTPTPKPSGPSGPKTVIRGGFGIFYNRIGEDLILQTLRYNGINQRQFVVTDPAVLDLFPLVPGVNALTAFAQPQTRRLLSPDLAPNYSLRGSVSLERQLSKNYKLSLTYSYGKTLRAQRTVNINAPLAGTFNPAIPTSGVRPLGPGAGNVLEYESNGRTRYDNFSVNLNGKLKKVNFWSTYVWSKTRNADNGTSGSSFDPYDFSQEWGRSNFDIRHWFYAGTDYQTKSGFNINSFIIANSGPPFNITTGRDANGDTFFTERPAFATDLTKPGVIVTPIGAFDPNPVAGQQIIPKNFGQGPTFFSVNIGISKVTKFGRAIPPKTTPPVGPGAVVNSNAPATATSTKPPEKPPIQRPYSLVFAIYLTNALNHANKSTPVGNMSSPFFLQSTSTSGMFFFGPGGGGSGGNRQVSLRVRLSF